MGKKSLSSRLSRKEPNPQELIAAFEEFVHGSDRVAAIMGATFAESRLTKLMRASLADPTDERALFQDEGAPFGTFKRKIVAGKAMGLLSDEIAADLDLIRDIRNQFAHALMGLNFKNEHIRSECMKITEYPVTGLTKGKSEARSRFEQACWSIAELLMDKGIEILEEQLRAARINDPEAASLQSRAENILGDGPSVE